MGTTVAVTSQTTSVLTHVYEFRQMVATAGDSQDVIVTALLTGLSEIVVRCTVVQRDALFHYLLRIPYEPGEQEERRMFVVIVIRVV